MSKSSSKRIYIFAGLIASTLLLVLFQNCSKGFEALSGQQSLGSLQDSVLQEDPPDHSEPLPPSEPSEPPPEPPEEPAPPLTPLPPVDPIDVNYSGLKAKAMALQPGHWVEIPTTNKFMNVTPPREETTWAIVGPSSAVTAWSGGALGKDAFYIWGGGHNDYGGNEVYQLRLTDLTWERMTNPSKYITPCASVCKTVDDAPTSTHSYDGVQYIFEIDRLWVGSGSGYPSGNGAQQSYFFNVSNRTWEKRTVEQTGWLGSDWDPINKLLLINNNGARLTAWDPITDTYHNTSSNNWSVGDVSAALDWRTRRYVTLSAGDRGLLYWELKDVKFRDPTSKIPWNGFAQTYRIVNGNKVEFMPSTANRMGLEYDPDKGVLVAWDGGPSVWTLNTETWVWSEIVPQGSAHPNTFGKTRGVYGRWRYIPSLKVFFGYNDVDGNPWLFKMP